MPRLDEPLRVVVTPLPDHPDGIHMRLSFKAGQLQHAFGGQEAAARPLLLLHNVAAGLRGDAFKTAPLDAYDADTGLLHLFVRLRRIEDWLFEYRERVLSGLETFDEFAAGIELIDAPEAET